MVILGLVAYGLLAKIDFDLRRLLPAGKPIERRCTVCKYELTQNVSGRCPECRMPCEMDPTCRELRPQIREARILHARRKKNVARLVDPVAQEA